MTPREQYELACRITRIAKFDLMMMHKAFVRRGLSPERLIFAAHMSDPRTARLCGWRNMQRHNQFWFGENS